MGENSLEISYEDLIKKIANGFRNETLAVWCGAGISIPSGLPAAKSLVLELLSNTRLSHEEQDLIASIVPEHLPFERLMETILDTMDETAQNQLLSIFSLGKPSQAHIFLAKLAKRGMATTICTTNFDTHIEKAFDELGLVRNEDYVVLYEPENFGDIDWQQKTIRLIKLHGSVDALDKLGVTVRRVAEPGSMQKIENPTKSVFRGRGEGELLVLGYSFSDKFDISPAIEKLADRENATDVIVLDFTSPGDRKFSVTDTPEKQGHPLCKYPKKWFIHGDSAEVVLDIAKTLNISLSTKSSDDASDQQTWEVYLQALFTKLNEKNGEIAGFHLAGSLLTMVSDDRRAIQHFRKTVELAENTGNSRMKLIAYQSLAGGLIRTNEVDEALSILKKAEPIALEIKEGTFADHMLSQRASLYQQLGDECYKKARGIFNSALEISMHDSNYMRRVPHLSGIATSWMKLGDFDAAEEVYKRILNIVEDSGDLYRKAEVYGNFASMMYILRQYNPALSWYSKASETSALAGDSERVGIHAMNAGNVYVKLEEYDTALDFYRRAQSILEPIYWKNHPTLQLLEHHIQLVQKRIH